MARPRVPGADDDHVLELPCEQTVDTRTVDLGMREYDCPCGNHHAVVLDVHPPSRFVPEALVETLREAVDTEDEFAEFGTPHVLGMVIEEFPERVVVRDAADDGTVGYTLCWITDFDSHRLHEIVVELLVELMDHAVSHADDETATAEFDELLSAFDIEAFVEEYRRVRDFESEFDRPV